MEVVMRKILVALCFTCILTAAANSQTDDTIGDEVNPQLFRKILEHLYKTHPSEAIKQLIQSEKDEIIDFINELCKHEDTVAECVHKIGDLLGLRKKPETGQITTP
jgi:hypothetical protein